MKTTLVITLAVLVLLPMFAGQVFAEKKATFREIMRPETITLDADYIYIKEKVPVYIYSMKNFQFFKKFGRQGDGPQEIKPYPAVKDSVFIMKGRIMVNSVGKVLYYSPTGDYIEERKTAYPFARYKPLGDGFVGYGEAVAEKLYYQVFYLYNSKFERGRELYRRLDWAQDRIDKGNNPVDAGGAEFIVFGNKVFIGDRNENSVFVFDHTGKKINTIIHDFEKLKVSAAHQKEYHRYYKHHPFFKDAYEAFKKTFKFPAYFPGFRTFRVAGDRVYIMTFKRKGDKTQFLVFDLEGKFQKETFLPVGYFNIQDPYPFAVFNGKLYQLVENLDEEQWELHTFPI